MCFQGTYGQESCSLKSTLTTDPAVSANFNINELESALKSVKPGMAAGFDGVYPEFIHNFGERTKEWCPIVSQTAKMVQTGKGYRYSKARQR
jgi:hypothetical protein